MTPSSRLAADYSKSHGRKVRELMSETVITATPDAPLSEITDGVVDLWGLVGSPEERKALFALAESVPGVQGVSDELISSY